jgi:hypothetical protein
MAWQDNNYEATAAFVTELRERTLLDRERVFLNFEACRIIKPSAGLLLTAEALPERLQTEAV